MSKARIIFHVDMNSFYASVEQSYNPELKGKAIAIAGNPKERRGIIVTSSYEARAKGIYTTMNVGEALRKCPELILLPPDFPKYRQASKAMFTILRSYTELIEPVSIDEGYMDITELSKERHPLDIAKEIQLRIFNELDLPCSIGIAPNKFLAKTASDMEKPMGITVLRKRDVPSKLWPLPVIEMHGVGESTAKKLNSINIKTIGDLAKIEESVIRQQLGKNGVRLRARANGEDSRIVDPEAIYETKSVGNSTTLPFDETDIKELEKIFEMLAGKVAERLEVKNLCGSTISIQIRDANWNNHSKSKTFQNPIYQKEDIFEEAFNLFHKAWNGEPVRLLGITVSNVIDRKQSVQQLSIFNFEEYAKQEPIYELIDEMERKFGKGILKKGVEMGKKQSFASKTSFSKDFLEDLKE
ncbi:DNA polymerase IV [Lysinibacillus endophyticus]|uniref:DNA polymerase IV n=1 Tax=Ureibacillus endophyticus TaxID=1978490 RepID=A0A494Z7M8_9BACL|nr:DNA polymerase IV [Lysinibacillus endophyticus]MCP1145105.1 DNA polymerase IV [Lysinibacillus endophyticus]RKQ18523.1 DNA polymerase IV [Lysinibacillus endophyticus]